MSVFEGIIGHQAQTGYFERVLAGGKLAHAYCFSGPRQVGKRAVANCLASSNPMDAIVIESDGSISVEQIREARERFSMTSLSGGTKILLIDGAESMTIAAQNALLKTLEEPRGDALIILIAHDASQLLPTILSRTVHIRFTRIPDEVICDALKARGLGREESHELAALSIGRPGLALSLLDPDARAAAVARQQEARAFLAESLPARIRRIDALKKAERDPSEFIQDVLLVARSEKSSTAALESLDALRHNGNINLCLEHFGLAL